jgi:hypothetical protein
MLPGLFNITQFGYWQKSILNYNTYWILTVLLGWFAIDQLYLRSPITFVLKLIGNLFLFGIPYIYDILQVSLNQDKVKLFGSSMPILGQVGAGAGMFYENISPMSAEDSDRKWNFMIYAFILLLTGIFGGDSYFLGDNMSGIIRTILTVSVIGLPLAIAWWVYNIYIFFAKTGDLLDQNWQFFGAPEPEYPIPQCPGILQQITVWVWKTGIVVAEQVPGLNLMVPWMKTVLSALEVAYGFTKETVKAVVEAAPKIAAAVEATAVDQSAYQKAVAEQKIEIPKPVLGGGSTDGPGLLGYGLLGTIALITVSGGGRLIKNMLQNGSKQGSKSTDEPPKPRGV